MAPKSKLPNKKVPTRSPGDAAKRTNTSESKWGDRVPGRRAQRELKEEVLYETAARWFNKHGYHGTSLSDLASELGITKAAIYNYVADKRELLYNIHVRSLQAAKQALEQARNEKTGLDQIRRMIFNYVAAITVSPTVTFILLEDGALAPEQAEEILAARSALDHEFRDLVADGIRDKSIVQCDPRLASFLITGGMAWIGKWYDAQGAWSGDQVGEGISALYARMLGAAFVEKLPANVGDIVSSGGLAPLNTK